MQWKWYHRIESDKPNYGMIRYDWKPNLIYKSTKIKTMLVILFEIMILNSTRKQKLRKQGSPEWTSSETYLKKRKWMY
jgi:hypothetical protein